MTGDELFTFDLQVGVFSRQPRHEGLFHADITAKAGGRTVRITYYWSPSLNQLFVVGAHLVRRGEPSEWDQEQMDEYVGAILEWESNPGSGPENFVFREGD